MPNEDAYKRFLANFGMSVSQVPPILPQDLMGNVLGLLNRQKGQIAKSQQSQFSELLKAYETNTTNLIMQNISRDLSKRIAQLGLPKQCDVYAGVFPTNSFNAQATLVGNGALVLIDVGCFSLIEAITMLFAWNGDMERKTVLACQFIKRYVSDYAIPSPKEYDHPSLHDGIRLMAFTQVVSKAEEFVLAHEHAHVALGHLWTSKSKAMTPVGEVPMVSKSREQEIEADKLGVHLMLSTKLNDVVLKQIGAAPYVVFGIAYLIEKAIESIHHTRYEHWDTHPPAVVRGALIERAMSEWGVSKSLDLGQKIWGWVNECANRIQYV
ncbi:MAG: hypothetical protein KGJ80_09830 [Chloroflexota bacterium]|nr:hypothetical protein [Chloroflexota bacterium]